MKKIAAIFISCLITFNLVAGSVEKVFIFSQVKIGQNGQYQTVLLDRTMLAGRNGEPMLPYHQIAMMLPPGEKAISIRIIGEALTPIPGIYELFPQQMMQPISKGPDGKFIKNEAVYRSTENYPATPTGNLINSCLNGYAFALSTFTPVIYNPGKKAISYYQKVTVRIETEPDINATLALKNLTASESALKRVRLFAQNPEMMHQYPAKASLKTNYQILIVTRAQFETGFQDLVNYYAGKGLSTQIATIETIGTMSGQDLPEKIRNYIINEYQNSGIEQVILGGDVEWVPYRGLYCYVVSGSGYEDNNIPADIYFSALDGNWNANGNSKWGEAPTLTNPTDEADLLPEISVGRMSFSNASEQAKMVHKSVSYQGSPVVEEMRKPYLVSEFLYDPPTTYGSDYLELLIDNHDDNGYSTYGIPSTQNTITRLYDTPTYNWSVSELLAGINSGQSFIHHCGHSNSNYMMRLYNWDITNQNFSQVNGITHNYQLMYTHGCICGAFDDADCIGELSTSISNFLVGGVFNSRYGWFDQGTTEGPSAHLHREFISALYSPNPDSAISELGSAHSMSKIKSAPWIGLPGEFEPGAQRWCHYDCNVLGDPALKVWIANPSVGTPELSNSIACSLSPNPCKDLATISMALTSASDVTITVNNSLGQQVLTHTYLRQTAGNLSLTLHTASLPIGIYYVCVKANETSVVKKLMISR
ncbi:MAG: C25 family cysteine peptidase [Bacteroidetes bacterium]|nr:C25 family cysteine peptidase [Bacteroidota bacterium]